MVDVNCIHKVSPYSLLVYKESYRIQQHILIHQSNGHVIIAKRDTGINAPKLSQLQLHFASNLGGGCCLIGILAGICVTQNTRMLCTGHEKFHPSFPQIGDQVRNLRSEKSSLGLTGGTTSLKNFSKRTQLPLHHKVQL